VRNLALKNPVHQRALLDASIERLVRDAMETHETCRDVAHAALRDLEVDGVEFRELWKGAPKGSMIPAEK